MGAFDSWSDFGSGLVEVGTLGAVKGAFGSQPTVFGRKLSDLDPTKVAPVETGAYEQGVQGYGEAAKQAQQQLADYFKSIKAPTVAKTAGPTAGAIDTKFLQALQGQLPSQQQALRGMAAQGVGAQQMTAESAEMMRQAALGQAPSAAQLQQKQAFEQAVAAQMAAQAGRGYDPAAIRQAQVAGQQLQAQQAQQGAILAAQEQQAARAQYAQTAQGAQQLGMQAQELQLRAAQGDVNAQLQLANMQAELAKAQAGLTTQAGIAGAQIAGQTAVSEAQLQAQNQAQMNNLYLQYLNLGMEPARAQMEAQKAIFGAQWERSQLQTAARQKAFGGILSGIGSIGGAMVGGPAGAAAGGQLGGGMAMAGEPAALPPGVA